MRHRLFVLALGNFAIGTEAFMIAGVLPAIAQELHVSLSSAGQLVTVFSLAYAIGSPVLAMFTGQVERRKLLVTSILLFALANFLCGLTSHYGTLVLGRVIAAIGAGLFALGIMGGGDVKLFAVTALWAGGPFIVLLLVTTAAAGGILALWWDRLLRFFSPTTPSLKAANGRPAIPYGAAIAAGGLIVAVNLV